MLSFRSRASRSGGGSSESHMSLPVPATSSLFDRKPFHASGNKTSLRGRLKDITKNITRRSRSRSIPEHNRNSMPGTPGPWYDVKSHDDLLCLAPADAQHVELAGQTWPAIRRNIGSMAPYLWTSRDSTDSSRSPGEVSHQSSGRNLKPGFGVFQEGGRRWATMVSRVHPMTCRRSTSRARRSSFSTISEAMSRQDYGPAPQLPMLTDSSDFLESLSKTGLFRRFTPLSEVNSTAGTIKVQNTTPSGYEVCTDNVRPIITRRPLRLRSPDALYHGAAGASITNTATGQHEASQNNTSDPSAVNADNSLLQPDHNRLQGRRRVSEEKNPNPTNSSRHPIEWLDRVLETSYATRNPISPKLCVSKATMDFLRQNRTCIFVVFPRGHALPEPLTCYPGFRAALEDICDRFGSFYAPFAAYNAHTRTINLYTTDTARPENRFIDDDTAIFNLELARSAWVRSIASDKSRPGVTPKTTSRESSEDLSEAQDDSRVSSEETRATDPEDKGILETEEPKA
ncbi:hypothetical protein GGS24DRAFT_496051 [Hypoxylon argillaceum]|nr:hypothetical protein GGS24DRAFT_496051 [Hypoxylon argillaceum]